MKSLQPPNYRYIPCSFLLESNIGFKAIRISDFVLQSGLNQNNEVTVAEEDGTGKLGSNILDATDGEVAHSVPKLFQPLTRLLRRPNTDGVKHDVEEFLARPFLLESGTFSSTDTPTTFDYWRCFQALTTSNMMTSKVRGAYLIRARTHVTLQINANRMQQGRYVLAFMPTGGMAVGSVEFSNYYYMHRYTKCEITQLRHINIDINCDTEVTLEIPYVSVYPGFCFSSTNPTLIAGDPGVFFLYPYRALSAAAGSTTASYQMFVHYTDIEIDGVGVAQMGKKIVSRNRGDFLKEESVSSRPISVGLKALSTVATAVGQIPLLNPIMHMSSVVADALSNAAYTMGWSKPILSAQQQRVRQEWFPYLSVSDSHDICDPLCLTLGNSTGILSGYSATDEDELSIDFLKSIPAWNTGVSITSATISGTAILTLPVIPAIVTSTNDTRNTIYSWAPIAFLARMFCYWKGSLVYTLKFTRTEFHSGRLLIRFIPFDGFAYANPGVTTNNKSYMLKAIVDIRECNEFSFTIPFLYTRNWADTTNDIGVVIIEVLDPIVAPATVPSTIYMDVEISGGPDLEFAVPTASGSAPSQPPDIKAQWPTVPYVLQSGLNGRNDCAYEQKVIGNATLPKMDFNHSASCFGEVFRSLRPLMKRGALTRDTLGGTNNLNCVIVSPRMIAIGRSLVASVSGSGSWDPYALIAPLFSTVRGGMRIKTIPLAGGPTATYTDKLTYFASLGIGKYAITDATTNFVTRTDTALTFMRNYMTGAMTVNNSLNGGVSVQLPYINNNPALCVGDNLYNVSSTNAVNSQDKVSLHFGQFNSDGTAPSNNPGVHFHRSVADDFNLAGFVSVPCTTIIIN
jgi:hypothetical protein